MSCCAGAIGGCSSPSRSTRVRERLARLTPVQLGRLQDLFLSAMDRLTVQPYTADKSLLRVLERRQRLKPVLCPARQHNLVVGELEAVVTDNHHVGAHAQEATN